MGDKAPRNSGKSFRGNYHLSLCIDLIYFFQLINQVEHDYDISLLY